MLRKRIVLPLVFLLCCALAVAAFFLTRQAPADKGEELDASTAATTPENTTAPTQSPTEPPVLIDVPEEILSAPTQELLEYFLLSPFMSQQAFPDDVTATDLEVDYTCHAAFRELINRANFRRVLKEYSGTAPGALRTDILFFGNNFKTLLSHPYIAELFSDPANNYFDYLNVHRVYENPDITIYTFPPEDLPIRQEEIDHYLVAPDEILSAPTPELLEYFLNSPFMREGIPLFFSSDNMVAYGFRYSQYFDNQAFCELIAREDFLEALEAHAKELMELLDRDDRLNAAFEKLLEQPLVQQFLS